MINGLHVIDNEENRKALKKARDHLLSQYPEMIVFDDSDLEIEKIEDNNGKENL